MANPYFQFKQFTVRQDASAMKVTTDACLFGAWCAAALACAADQKTVLDAGAGTGLLSLMVRQKCTALIDAVEIEEAAAAQAFQNIAASPWQQDFTVIHADLLRMDVSKRYDYIISNPPFYENQLQSPDANRNTAHHSRQLTLRHLINFIDRHVKPDGQFFLLLPYRRSEEARNILHDSELFIYNEVAVQQTPSHAPFRIMLQGGYEKGSTIISHLTISNGPNQYTPEFTALLQDYYLYL